MADSLLVTYPTDHQRHAPPLQFFDGEAQPHPDRPERVAGIIGALQAAFTLDLRAVSRHASDEELCQVHTPDLLDAIRWLSRLSASRNGPYLIPSIFPIDTSMARLADTDEGRPGVFCYDTFAPVGAATWEVATQSAACALDAARAIASGDARLAYALCRPPGHHATQRRYGGYCYLNNAALAARLLARTRRIAVLDLDYHHGNGTQEIFWEDAGVWTGSLHGDPALDYPFYSGTADDVGAGAGAGCYVNLPLPLWTGDADYLRALDTLLVSLCAFRPDAVVVPLGFDTYEHEPEGKFSLTAGCFTAIGSRLRQLALPLLIVQEGGYNVEVLGELAVRFFGGLGVARSISP